MSKKKHAAQLAEYQALLNEAARLFLEAVRGKMGGQPWVCAFADRRWFSDSSSVGKGRIQVPDSPTFVSIRPPIELINRLDEFWKLQMKYFDNVWYGLLLTIYPDGRCETKFNYYSGTKDCRTDGSSVLFRTDCQSVLRDLLSDRGNTLRTAATIRRSSRFRIRGSREQWLTMRHHRDTPEGLG